MKMKYTKLKCINQYKSESINPAKTPDTVFEMYSVPIYETGHPEYLRGDEIASNKVVVQKNDILLCKINPRINRVWVVLNESDKQNIASSEWIVIRNSEYNSEFLAWYFRSVKFQKLMTSEVTGIGGSLTRAQPKCVAEYPVPVLDRKKQNEIVEILNKCKFIIDLRKRELVGLDDLIKARFVEMFGDPKINDKCWNSGMISDFYKVKGGKRIPKGMGYADGITAHPYLRATDMKNETILDDDIHYIDNEVYEHIKRYTVKGGDIYLTNVGVNLGMAGVIPDKYDGANLTENAVKLVPKTEKVIDGRFLAHYINSPGIQVYINERKMSVGVPKLAIFRIETMPLLLPPIAIQMQFVQFCDQVNKSKVAVQKALDEIQLLFDSLMQKYFG